MQVVRAHEGTQFANVKNKAGRGSRVDVDCLRCWREGRGGG